MSEFYKTIDEFVKSMDMVHQDGIRLIHFARIDNDLRQERSTMPVTAFVYEFFIYNSLYQIDWFESIATRDFVYHPDRGEEKQQKEFERFLYCLCEKNLDIIRESFVGLKYKSLSGSWTRIVPDRRVTKEDGERFFNNLRKLQQVIHSKSLSIDQLPSIFESITQCRGFVYKIRCHIFHGRKTLAHVRDSDQQKRLEVYNLFLTCLVTSFFLLWRNSSKTLLQECRQKLQSVNS